MVPTEWVNEDSCSFLYMGGQLLRPPSFAVLLLCFLPIIKKFPDKFPKSDSGHC